MECRLFASSGCTFHHALTAFLGVYSRFFKSIVFSHEGAEINRRTCPEDLLGFTGTTGQWTQSSCTVGPWVLSCRLHLALTCNFWSPLSEFQPFELWNRRLSWSSCPWGWRGRWLARAPRHRAVREALHTHFGSGRCTRLPCWHLSY